MRFQLGGQVSPNVHNLIPCDVLVHRQTAIESDCMYKLEPSYPLPILDLSRTMKSEVFTPAMSRVFNSIRRHPMLLLIGYLLTTLSYLVCLLVPARVGGYIALAGVIIGIPGNYFVIAQMRYDILKILAPTFDVWFASIAWLILFTILAMVLNDLRAVIVVSFWLGSWPNTCHDAVLVTIRPIVIFNVICMFVSGLIVLGVNFMYIDGLRDFDIMRYGDSFLSARNAITSGFVTVAAIMARNVYRRRNVVLRRRRTSDLECVIYRCQLRFTRRQDSRDLDIASSNIHRDSVTADVEPHLQPMRYTTTNPIFDARQTVIPAAYTFVSSKRDRFGPIWSALAFSGVLLMLCGSVSIALSEICPFQLASLSAALVLTGANSIISLTLSQRDLLKAVCSSFDFAFVATQLTGVHVCACDMFGWKTTAILLAGSSWQWIHWALLMDALTPPVRQRFQCHTVLVRFLLSCTFAAGVLLVYMIIFADPPARAVDRVLWSGIVMGHTVHVRILPQFYSSLTMVFLLIPRYLWRSFRSTSSDLVVLDGTVVFKNSFARRRMKLAHVIPSPVLALGTGRTEDPSPRKI